ncbi:MAG: GNAT family N-acetyltransferase [Peptostreptococcaceae bacterium]
MIIRDAVYDDIDHISELYILNWKETYKGLLSEDYLNSLNKEYVVEKWIKYLENENRVFVAYEENEFLGFVASKKDDEEDYWYLDSLHITKNSRGKGIGTKLIHRVGQYALNNGYECMSICIVKGNDNAKRIYEKLGAVHYKDFIDDFGGVKSDSQKLIWKNLNVFN